MQKIEELAQKQAALKQRYNEMHASSRGMATVLQELSITIRQLEQRREKLKEDFFTHSAAMTELSYEMDDYENQILILLGK